MKTLTDHPLLIGSAKRAEDRAAIRREERAATAQQIIDAAWRWVLVPLVKFAAAILIGLALGATYLRMR